MAAQKKALRDMTVRLISSDGSQLRVLARVNKATGAATSCVIHSTAKDVAGKRTHARGASQSHATLAQATERVTALVANAITLGWVRPVTTGFTAKPDAFTAATLPGPGKAVASAR